MAALSDDMWPAVPTGQWYSHEPQQPVDAAEKTAIRIGRAVVDTSTCISAAYGQHCGNCARHCPAGAIQMAAQMPYTDGACRNSRRRVRVALLVFKRGKTAVGSLVGSTRCNSASGQFRLPTGSIAATARGIVRPEPYRW